MSHAIMAIHPIYPDTPSTPHTFDIFETTLALTSSPIRHTNPAPTMYVFILPTNRPSQPTNRPMTNTCIHTYIPTQPLNAPHLPYQNSIRLALHPCTTNQPPWTTHERTHATHPCIRTQAHPPLSAKLTQRRCRACPLSSTAAQTHRPSPRSETPDTCNFTYILYTCKCSDFFPPGMSQADIRHSV